ncbi:MAG: deoxyribose-phosphate aldolase [Melioribacter sp.]|nr:deoxyribose-phosphate aldolase [Melioribacter sp.]
MKNLFDKNFLSTSIESTLNLLNSKTKINEKLEINIINQLLELQRSFKNDFESLVGQYVYSKELNTDELAKFIDHTLLKPDATLNDIEKLCEEAKEFKFAAVCVNPCYVSICKDLLKNSYIKVCTVIGFPLGATTTEVKVFEAEEALRNGAKEIDMVINIGMLKNKNYQYVFNDIKQVVKVSKMHNGICKVIIENALLTDEEKIIACLISKQAGADFVKTSTGFSKSGANAKDVALMKYVVGFSLGVKASGGIRTAEDAKLMIINGANRIGTSSGVKIIKGET